MGREVMVQENHGIICDKCGELMDLMKSGHVSLDNSGGDYWIFSICDSCVKELVDYIAPDREV